MATKKVSKQDLPVHPSADIFPMLPDDELQELAADIKANGLIHPIVTAKVGKKETLIDGRNRLAACKIAKVKPDFTNLNGVDPEVYILSSNIHRRHMTKGAQAMAVAMMFPEATRHKKAGALYEKNTISRQSISHARTVLKVTPTAAPLVLSGDFSLHVAYKEAKQVALSNSGKERVLEQLKLDAPDLAELVAKGKMDLGEAAAAAAERKRVAKTNRDTSFSFIQRINNVADLMKTQQSINITADLLLEYPDEYKEYAHHSVSDLKKSMKVIEKQISKLIGELK